MNGIEVKKVSKYYGQTCALNNISLTFEKNKIYGLLGRNGAGKSTLLNIITNRIFADHGEVFVDGLRAEENDKAQSNMYLMSEKNYYPDKMKLKDIFKWTKQFYRNFDMEYARQLAEKFDLNCDKSVKQLSTGYLSIFKLVVALSVNTPYVFLDEPVLGLDANNRDLFYRILLEKYSITPFTIVISTHLIEEITSIIEEIIIIKNGSIVQSESMEEFLGKGYAVSGPAALVDSYTADKQIIATDTLGGLKTAYILGKPENRTDGLEISNLNLQKLFIQMTNS